MKDSHATTVLAVRHRGSLVFGADGQVTVGETIMKHGAAKIRKLHNDSVLLGFAGSAADGFALYERFEGKLNEFDGKLDRAAVELAKDWRMDQYLRRLEAMLVVGDRSGLFLVSGIGDVIEPDDGVLAIGSGGNFALSSARGLLRAGREDLSTREIVEVSMNIAAELCPFTNNNFKFEEIETDGQ